MAREKEKIGFNRVVCPERQDRTTCPSDPYDQVTICTGRCRRISDNVRIKNDVAVSETFADRLRDRNIPFNLLNAVKHQEEAKIIASGGQAGAVTIATNMAGRGADIKLGKGVAELGGLHVIVSERHESGRIDRQLCGRCARQGDPGSVRTYASLEDELRLQYGPKPFLKLLLQTISRNRPESNRPVGHLISLAQQKAQRQAFRQRQIVMQTDDWLTDALSFARSELDQ